MALPKLEYAKYNLTVPSTGQSIEYRPFTVKEEKILLMAAESDDNIMMFGTIKDLVRSCTFDSVKPEKITLFDMEYIFLNIRAKSVGETLEFMYKPDFCYSDADMALIAAEEALGIAGDVPALLATLVKNTPCHKEYQINVDLAEAEIMQKQGANWVKLSDDPNMMDVQKTTINFTDDVGMELKWPTLKEIDVEMFSGTLDEMSIFDSILWSSVVTVFDKSVGEVQTKSDFTREEFDEMIGSLQSNQTQAILDFFDAMPRLRLVHSFQCDNCVDPEDIVFEGLESFFG